MKNWKSVLLLALVFLAGIGVGVLGTRASVRRVVQQAIAHPEKVQLLTERKLTRNLHLDTEQQAKLHTILTESRGQLRDLRKDFQPRTAAVFRATDEKIFALLTPEQQSRYQKLKIDERPLFHALRQEP